MTFQATKHAVANRGTPPDSFLSELVAWGRTAPDEIFAPRPAPPAPAVDLDVYASVKAVLGPWQGILHRKAVMLEILRVLSGFESSWNWNEGRDMNAGSESPFEMEAGAFQVSANSISFGKDLKDCVSRFNAGDGPLTFQVAMKTIHPLAIEYAARLLRHTTHHNGPVLRHEIDPFLRRDSVAEFETLIA